MAAVVPGFENARALVGVHRPLEAEHHAREFKGSDARAAALKFVARWVELRAAQILAEYEARPYR